VTPLFSLELGEPGAPDPPLPPWTGHSVLGAENIFGALFGSAAGRLKRSEPVVDLVGFPLQAVFGMNNIERMFVELPIIQSILMEVA